ncbi:MAG: PhzF family phenazine biosynthesis protein [Ignavibacteriales bacterium]|nr:PhzF family phenazine biosynthesis protein [Ignavibacteriales bacterium]
MRKIKVKTVDAFTLTPNTGNPAGVVLDASDLSDMMMQKIAREINLSETAFVCKPKKADTDVHLRWFTPTTEVNLCGHATVAAFHALAQDGLLGMKDAGEYNFKIETASGILPVEVVKETGRITVWFGLKHPVIDQGVQPKVELIRVLDINPGEFENRAADVCDKNLFVQVKRLHTLFTMKPNFTTMSYFLASRNLEGLCVYATETVDRDSKVHSRFFAPTIGINEDPVTGSAHGPLAFLLYENGYLKHAENFYEFQGEQGDVIGRKGRVRVQIELRSKKITSVRIGGNAITVMDGEMQIHE